MDHSDVAQLVAKALVINGTTLPGLEAETNMTRKGSEVWATILVSHAGCLDDIVRCIQKGHEEAATDAPRKLNKILRKAYKSFFGCMFATFADVRGFDFQAVLNGECGHDTNVILELLHKQLSLGRSKHVLGGAWLGVFDAVRRALELNFPIEHFGGHFDMYNVKAWKPPTPEVYYPLVGSDGELKGGDPLGSVDFGPIACNQPRLLPGLELARSAHGIFRISVAQVTCMDKLKQPQVLNVPVRQLYYNWGSQLSILRQMRERYEQLNQDKIHLTNLTFGYPALVHQPEIPHLKHNLKKSLYVKVDRSDE